MPVPGMPDAVHGHACSLRAAGAAPPRGPCVHWNHLTRSCRPPSQEELRPGADGSGPAPFCMVFPQKANQDVRASGPRPALTLGLGSSGEGRRSLPDPSLPNAVSELPQAARHGLACHVPHVQRVKPNH